MTKILPLLLCLFTILQVCGQANREVPEPFYVNVFISADKTIYVETDKSDFDRVEHKVSHLLRQRPFKIDQPVVYRVFGDENLKLGYIKDVNREMLNASTAKDLITQYYLLDTRKLNIDGQDWFDAIDFKTLEKPSKFHQ